MDGFVSVGSFSTEKIQSPIIKSILDKTNLHEDPELTQGYPNGIPNRVTLETTDGKTFTSLVEFPSGHVNNPMTDKELEYKFKKNVEQYFTQAQVNLVADLVCNLEKEQNLERLMESMNIQ